MGIELNIKEANEMLCGFTAQERIQWAYWTFDCEVISTTSGGKTSAVLPHLIKTAINTIIPIIFVDTKYYNHSTLEMASILLATGNDIRTYTSNVNREEIEQKFGKWYKHYGSNDFEKVSLILKQEPLNRALAQLQPQVWIRGIRKYQTVERRDASFLEFKNGLYRLHPILDWGSTQTNQYIEEQRLPTNPRHYDVFKGQDQKLECKLGEAGLSAQISRPK